MRAKRQNMTGGNEQTRTMSSASRANPLRLQYNFVVSEFLAIGVTKYFCTEEAAGTLRQ